MATEKEKNRERMRRIAQDRKERNLCVRCGKQTPREGSSACSDCTEKSQERHRRRKAVGFSPELLERRRSSNREFQATYRRRREEKGLCKRCGKEVPRPGKKSCQNCFEQQRKSYQAAKREGRLTVAIRSKNGVCVLCGKNPARPDSPYCTPCRQYRQIHYRGRRAMAAAIIERDGYACRLCGSDKKLHVHHIDGNGKSSGTPIDDPANLITLCVFCHHAVSVLRRHTASKDLAAHLILAS